jgi:hypothetical protein
MVMSNLPGNRFARSARAKHQLLETTLKKMEIAAERLETIPMVTVIQTPNPEIQKQYSVTFSAAQEITNATLETTPTASEITTPDLENRASCPGILFSCLEIGSTVLEIHSRKPINISFPTH